MIRANVERRKTSLFLIGVEDVFPDEDNELFSRGAVQRFARTSVPMIFHIKPKIFISFLRVVLE